MVPPWAYRCERLREKGSECTQVWLFTAVLRQGHGGVFKQRTNQSTERGGSPGKESSGVQWPRALRFIRFLSCVFIPTPYVSILVLASPVKTLQPPVTCSSLCCQSHQHWIPPGASPPSPLRKRKFAMCAAATGCPDTICPMHPGLLVPAQEGTSDWGRLGDLDIWHFQLCQWEVTP